MRWVLLIPLFFALLDIFFVFYLIGRIKKVSPGQEKIKEISQAIKEGARAFLKREFKSMILIFLLVAFLLGIIQKTPLASIIFLLGAFASSLAGYVGMTISTLANSRTANKAQEGFAKSFKIAIWGGEVMGFLVVGLGLLGVIIVFSIFKNPNLLINYAFGASFVALFMRVGGGIYTKSADVGADIVGKTELKIPEDDPRNPAVIADNVGDNVGDIAGMGADLFESYVSTIIAAMVIGVISFGLKGLFLPLLLSASGIFSSILASFLMRVSDKLNQAEFIKQTEGVRRAMEKGILFANLLMVVFALLITNFYFRSVALFWPILAGLICGVVIGKTTEYYTSEKRRPTLEVAKASQIGASNVIMEGLVAGMKSTLLPVLAVGITIVLAYHFGGLYGIALASLGILGVLGINLSTDCYGPIADNAAGIAQMAGLDPKVRQRTEALDAVGNSTAATGKGFAIGAAALASLSWLATYSQQSGLKEINLLEPKLLAGLFVGSMLPFLFSALAMKGVSQGALEVVKEVRRQFKEKVGLLEGKVKPDYKRTIDLVTRRALKEMSFPAVLVIVTPILIGVVLGKEAVAGTMVGALGSGFLLALLMANSGACWDNAKKYIEAGNFGGKGSDAHKAAVVGDTLGDPFKDTAGPSLNILIKLIGVVSLLALPLFL
jgi:K(+)-stimulated pyrophosphate-energized sodium pump